MWYEMAISHFISLNYLIKSIAYRDIWRRERDSNPRYGCPYTRVPGVRLQPLGHLSSARTSE
ncbi:hypothetical protein CHELA1G11_10287 [Hyphomicrobiales bacterium]|nr:hypothetical protein CHELA1G11_10287 [Hyphomicrobiales bacterium]CAH1675736.1 hypothetical protein CHELA1G2_14018 [Hyphomicrobiales bacterium]